MTLKLLLGKSEEEDPSRLVWAASDRNRLIVVLGGRGERGRGGEIEVDGKCKYLNAFLNYIKFQLKNSKVNKAHKHKVMVVPKMQKNRKPML